MISYFLSNISAKSYHNRIVYVKIIASRRWDFFRHGADTAEALNGKLCDVKCTLDFAVSVDNILKEERAVITDR